MSTSYGAFLGKMQQPAAAGLLRSMKEFVRQAAGSSTVSVDELAGSVQAFFREMEAAMAEHELWRGAELDEFERTCDGVEKFVMSKLHDRVFAHGEGDEERDTRLMQRMRELQFLTVEHLGISEPFTAQQPWEWAQQELLKMGSYRTPRDKLVCALNCCKRINAALARASAGSHGADEFFPVLIYVVLQAVPPQLHSTLQYIARFRHASRLISESAYYLTHLSSVATFLVDVGADQLTINSTEFDRQLANARAALRAEAAADAANVEMGGTDLAEPTPDATADATAGGVRYGRSNGASASWVSAALAAHGGESVPKVAVSMMLHASPRPPQLRFLEVGTADELSLGDVAELLAEYKWLSRNLQTGAATPRSARS